MTGEGGPLDAGRFAAWLDDMDAALRGERDADVPCAGCTACCTSSQFVHIGPDETDTIAHIDRRCSSRRRCCRAATSYSGSTPEGTARCSSRAVARSTSTGRAPVGPTTAGCSRPRRRPRRGRQAGDRGAGPALALRDHDQRGRAGSGGGAPRRHPPPRAPRRRTGPAGEDGDPAGRRRRRAPPTVPEGLKSPDAPCVSEHSLI